jgi:hypothetical protein
MDAAFALFCALAAMLLGAAIQSSINDMERQDRRPNRKH